MYNVLIADDDVAVRQAIRLCLMGDEFVIQDVGTLEEAHASIQREVPDLFLLDVHFSQGKTCLALLEKLKNEGIELPIIVLSGEASAAEAAQSIRLGAYDFIEKPLTHERLRLTIKNCLKFSSINRFFRDMTSARSSYGLVGDSEQLRDLRKAIEKIGSKDVKVLITGETGVGKEVVAQSLWQASTRQAKPFIVVNAAAIPENLVESELFGHRKGAFTGALRDQAGKIEMADGGTLFIDEIGDLPQNAQTKLLRFLETGEVQKVGAPQIRHADVRIIAATSKDIEREVVNGQFRKDLYFRINVARIHIPPLRERKSDIFLLFKHFINGFSKKTGVSLPTIDLDVEQLLISYSWPGNVRELRNLAETILIDDPSRIAKAEASRILKSYALVHADEPDNMDARAEEPPQGLIIPIEGRLSLKKFRSIGEKIYIEKVLQETQGSIKDAAHWLEIDRSYLHQKMQQLGITKDPSRG
ncbi:MAG TPA: sigma-54 dependent transcriptional regulator [Oligoflexus sp.]|uniref:sigma-54-dependent transcriptional regulator n=1 Tax=Oligoflexus sp. TaxID=1971216 RepID=UPI002D4CFC16|nr:sigma-54 dependent transcriptional regulator [Oligoflexus sp.]HYX31825.1 sigma-54 dependent transcriptional regulator [Oligoflexus sp.]